MEEKYGLKGTFCNDVFFTESQVAASTQVIKHIKVEISRQNSNLNEVKVRMAQEAKAIGANSVANFRYGQKTHQWWEYVFTFKWDTESWHGEGDAIKL